MTRPDNHAELIGRLARNLEPVGRLPSPGTRATAWLAIAVAFGAVLAALSDLSALRDRILATPEIGVAMLASALTAALAAWAAFLSVVPGRNARWALLPLPALLAWIVASGLGCLGASLGAGEHPASLQEAVTECVPFLAMVSLPLSLVLALMLRRGFATKPGQTGLLGGLAAAAAAATLLNFFHPFDVAVLDLVVHGLAVGLISIAGYACGHWRLGS